MHTASYEANSPINLQTSYKLVYKNCFHSNNYISNLENSDSMVFLEQHWKIYDNIESWPDMCVDILM